MKLSKFFCTSIFESHQGMTLQTPVKLLNNHTPQTTIEIPPLQLAGQAILYRRRYFGRNETLAEAYLRIQTITLK